MKELRADDRLLSRRGEGMTKHKRRILHILAITALAVSGFIAAGALAVTGYATDSTTTVTTTPEGEGCTPGFWKQDQHFDSWPVPITTTFGDVGFMSTGWPSSTTLLAALSFQGGPTVQDAKNILLRAAAAAYLNSLAVDYPLDPGEVVSMVNTALASGDRDTILALAGVLDANNNLGCPLD
jgi:hypothetical protein